MARRPSAPRPSTNAIRTLRAAPRQALTAARATARRNLATDPDNADIHKAWLDWLSRPLDELCKLLAADTPEARALRAHSPLPTGAPKPRTSFRLKIHTPAPAPQELQRPPRRTLPKPTS